jgi:hypothetical protein
MITKCTLCVAALTLLAYMTWFALVVCAMVAMASGSQCDPEETRAFLIAHMVVGMCVMAFLQFLPTAPGHWHLLLIMAIQLGFGVWGMLVVTNAMCTHTRVHITACVHVGFDFLCVLGVSCGLTWVARS